LRTVPLALGALLAILAPLPTAEAGCPPPDEVLARLAEAGLERASRTALFEWEVPIELIAGAAETPGRARVETVGLVGFAVMLAEMPVEPLWMAINDEEHFITEGYLPLVQSEVIDGTSRGGERLIYQSFKKFGIGRWWVNRVWQNRELYESSNGELWELAWQDVMAEVDPHAPPLDGLIDDVTPIDSSRGAWLLVPVGESCTLMEYFTDSDPGGLITSAQRLFGGRTLRATIEGMVVLALEEIPAPHEGSAFERPDGTEIER
jgi:hypothetical protein